MNDSVPLRAVPPADVTVAESFGSHVCSEAVEVESFTTTHSLWLESLDPR